MEGMTGDLFATKGIEYLLVIAYLALLVAGWKFIFPKPKPRDDAHEHYGPLPHDYFFHQGHSWAHAIDETTVRIGLDDFAQKAIGHPAALVLPARGTVLSEGEPAWEVQHANGDYFAMLAPVSGMVVDVNEDVAHAPGLVNSQPYDEGWLLEVRADSDAYRRNLLSGELAQHWMELAHAIPPEQRLDVLLASEQLSEAR